MRQVHVSIGVIAHAGRVLITRRRAGDRFEKYWEFPGGKVQAGETPEQCVHREIGEELGITVAIAAALGLVVHDYGDFTVCLHPYVLTLTAGIPRPLAARALKWIPAEDLPHVTFPPANTGLAAELPRLLAELKLA